MGLKSVFPDELRPGQIMVHRGGNYRVDLVKSGRPYPDFVSVHTIDKDGLLTIWSIPCSDQVYVVIVRDKTTQRESAQRKDASWQSRRVPGSSR